MLLHPKPACRQGKSCSGNAASCGHRPIFECRVAFSTGLDQRSGRQPRFVSQQQEVAIPEDRAEGSEISQQKFDVVLNLLQASPWHGREALECKAQGVKLSTMAASSRLLRTAGWPFAVRQSQSFRSPFGPRSWGGTMTRPRTPNSFYVRPERASWVFKFHPSQRLRKLFGWSSTYRGEP